MKATRNSLACRWPVKLALMAFVGLGAPFSRAADDERVVFSPETRSWIVGLIRQQVPPEIVEDSDWGGTTEVFAGVRLLRDGLRITTKRRRERVKHGLWKMVRLRLDPEHDFDLHLGDVRREPGGLGLEVVCDARVAVLGRVARWQTGLQLYSLCVEADTRVRFTAHVVTQVGLDPTRLPPDIVLNPHVTTASLKLQSFRVQRISELEGRPAAEVGRLMEELVEWRLEREQADLPARINRALDKRKDSLRLSAQDALVRQWQKLQGK